MNEPNQLSIENQALELIRQAVEAYWREQGPEGPLPVAPTLEVPRDERHGDWATSVALRLAKPLKKNPLAIAEAIAARLPANPILMPPDVARPGFINLRLSPAGAARVVRRVLEQGAEYGRSDAHAGHKALIEFVSANPTGPLHIGHARGAIIGDALARTLAAAGYEVYREYYYNDAGVQMERLGQSLRARYLQALGVEAPFPEDGYRGDYIVELAGRLKTERGDALKDEADWRPFTAYGTKHIIGWIDVTLRALRIDFDNFFSETALHEGGQVRNALERLKSRGMLYERDGAWWLKSTEYGDEKDRVVVKSDGNFTYLAPDIAYHEYKFERGFERLINILGADHHGYVPRLKAGVAALGHRPEQLDCVIVQMVSVQNEGVAIKQSKRQGDAIMLQEVIEAIGADVTRFLFLTRSADSQMVFDFKLAMDTSMENPVYYVQYAHARCCSLARKAEESGLAWRGLEASDPSLLTADEERAIARQIDRFPGIVLEVARTDEPMLLTAYLRDLATSFHAYFTAGNTNDALRVVRAGEPVLTQARLALIAALRRTLANALGLLGVVPLERL